MRGLALSLKGVKSQTLYTSQWWTGCREGQHWEKDEVQLLEIMQLEWERPWDKEERGKKQLHQALGLWICTAHQHIQNQICAANLVTKKGVHTL